VDTQASHPRPDHLDARDSPFAEFSFARIEAVIYLTVGLLLAGVAGLLLIGTAVDVADRAGERSVTSIAAFVLGRVLLLFIVAELLHTLRLVNLGGRILVEPFLFIGLIAVVRRILIATAEFEGTGGRAEVTDFVIQVGSLGALTLILALAIYVLRRSGPQYR
jgi:uncharacterized membrane protein (DUF373 family)